MPYSSPFKSESSPINVRMDGTLFGPERPGIESYGGTRGKGRSEGQGRRAYLSDRRTTLGVLVSTP